MIRIFLLSYSRTFEPRCGNIRLREKRRKGKGRKKSLEERHNRKTPRGTRVSTSLESQRAINHRAANIDWQINPEIEASSRSDQSQSEKWSALRSVGEENSVLDYDQPLFERSFSRLVASKGGEGGEKKRRAEHSNYKLIKLLTSAWPVVRFVN